MYPSPFVSHLHLPDIPFRYANEAIPSKQQIMPQAIKESLSHHNSFELYSSFTPSSSSSRLHEEALRIRKLFHLNPPFPSASRWEFPKRFPLPVGVLMARRLKMRNFFLSSPFMDIVLQFKRGWWWKIDTGSPRWNRLTPPRASPSSYLKIQYYCFQFAVLSEVLRAREKSFNGKIVGFRRLEVSARRDWRRARYETRCVCTFS